MALVAAKCTECGANIDVDNTKEAGICKHCGTAFVTEKAITNLHTNINTAYITNNIVYEADKADASSSPKRIIKPNPVKNEFVFPKLIIRNWLIALSTLIILSMISVLLLILYYAGGYLHETSFNAEVLVIVLVAVFPGLTGLCTIAFLVFIIPLIKTRHMINLIQTRNCEQLSLLEFGASSHSTKQKIISRLLLILQRGYIINYQLNLDHDCLERLIG